MKNWIVSFSSMLLVVASLHQSRAQQTGKKKNSSPDSLTLFTRLDADSLLELNEKTYLAFSEKSSLAFAEALALKAETIRVDSIQRAAWMRIAQVYLNLEKENLAEPFIQKLSAPLQKAGDLEQEAKLLHEIGKFCYRTGKDNLAIKYFSNIILLAGKSKNLSLQTEAYSSMTILFLRRGMNDKCIEFGLKTLPLAAQTGSSFIKNEITTGVGEAYERKEAWQEANVFFERSLALAYEGKTKGLIAQNLGKLCMINIKLNRIDSADYFAAILKKELASREIRRYSHTMHLLK